MKIDAIGVTSRNLVKSVAFYTVLGFKFRKPKVDDLHIEAKRRAGEPRFMIDSAKLMTEIIGAPSRPANHAAFALLCKNAKEVDAVAAKVKKAGFKIEKKPWDAVWGQRYAVVRDPDGYLVDLFAPLKK
ncbi:MAG: VOC family protein [Candidatus Pacebacteria bacterium]|nr:VOC family protein [Candidatus Paceibacterota bacterium]MBP9840283.1 VOC family protein [Candidatus Paceibacterota bacterium]